MDVSDLVVSTGASSSGTVHGVLVGEVSPIKTSRKKSNVKYFEGQFSDGKKTVRLVSFEPNLRGELDEAQKTQRSLALQNCIVKRNRDNDDFEIHVNNRTSLVQSPKKFKFVEDDLPKISGSPELGTLEQLKDLSEHQQISVTGKVQSIAEVEKVLIKSTGKQLCKQEFVIADGTAACRAVAWEDNIGKIKEGNSYKIMNVTVRSFNGSKYLSIAERSVIKVVDDIGYVIDEPTFDGAGGIIKINAELVAVLNTETYISCRNCNGKVIELNNGVGECSKCNCKMKMKKCKDKSVVRVILEESEGKEYKVSMFNEVIQEVIKISGEAADSGDITNQLLLSSELSYTINTRKETVCSVARILDT